MAPRAKAMTVAYQGGASDSEDDLLTAGASRNHFVKSAENHRGAIKSNKTDNMPAAKTATKRKAATKQPRQALIDKTNVQPGHSIDEDEEDEDEDVVASKPKAKRARTATAKSTAGTKKSRIVKTAPVMEPPLSTIPETQPESEFMENIEQSIEMDPINTNFVRDLTPPRLQRYAQRAPSVSVHPLQPRPSARAGSVQPGEYLMRERSGSAGVLERRGGDPQLRRELAEMTKKYESMQMKYSSLEELGKKGSETNFEKLKRASDQKAKDAQDLIASLKKEVAELKKISSSASADVTGMQKQISALTSTNEKLTTERDGLKSKLQESQNEVKTLDAKLMATRQQISNSALEAKAQETAAKNLPRNAVGAAPNEALKDAKMKENLYSDLTGLIIRAVKRRDGEDEYDCIQTGRNGTLHFHLSVGNDASTPHPKTPSGLSYEEAEFAYEPLLDENRDRDLLDLLPDYLTEEICFPRNHAQRFYTKLVDSMTRKIVVEED